MCLELYYPDEASMLSGVDLFETNEAKAMSVLKGVRCEDREVPEEQKYDFDLEEVGQSEDDDDGLCYSKMHCTTSGGCDIDSRDCM